MVLCGCDLSKQIRPLLKSDLPAIKELTDQTIGLNYYSLTELEEIYEKSQFQTQMCTLILEMDGKIEGVRITYPPGQWNHGKGQGLNPNQWPHPMEKMAYFQSLFITEPLTGLGYGKELSLEAIKILRSIGARGVVCHSWKESPHNSSGRYLRSLGFQLIATHPLYWNKVDYTCSRCGKPCLCTAEEMVLDLK